MMQAMVSRSEQSMTDFRDDQIDFERVVTDPEYRRHVIVFLNAQARGTKSYRTEVTTYPLLRRLG